MSDVKYKLTDENMKTHNGFQWELNKWYKADGDGDLCTKHWLHFYHHPLLAVLLNPTHANISGTLRLFEAEVEGDTKDDFGLKCGFTHARLIKEIPVPQFTLTQRVAFSIYAALITHKEKSFVIWAENWLSGKDRSKRAAQAARAAAQAARAAEAAARAAEAAEWAAAEFLDVLIQAAEKAYNFEKGTK